MQERALREAGENQQPTVHYFGSYFYPKLSESGYSYERVRRWSTTKRLGGYQLPYTERIIVPINKVGLFSPFIVNRFRVLSSSACSFAC